MFFLLKLIFIFTFASVNELGDIMTLVVQDVFVIVA